MLLTGAARILRNEGAVGVRQGHAELRVFVEEPMGRYGPALPRAELITA